MSFVWFWNFLDKYKEFIINGLDLLSWLLMTSEIARVFVPSLYKLLYFVYFNFITIFIAVPGLVKGLGAKTAGEQVLAWLLLSILFVFGNWFGLRDSLRFVGGTFTLSQELATELSRYAFGIGVLLFLLSRGIAFMLAAHNLPT